MGNGKRLPKPTPAELELLRTLWTIGPSSVKQVHEVQQRARPDLGYANVLRLMQIMYGKGLLNRDESQRSHVYSAAQKQGSMQTKLLDDFIHKAFAGSGRDLVMAALRGDSVSDAEREEIQRFLEETRND
ncbi:MAG: BlaI/MecI/CopY family transcriptional regulator [Proteobacteria bacterium]|nr:BlaI/MecI/CopY family transcriptional regulator [Pseudomonadota bacterium]